MTQNVLAVLHNTLHYLRLSHQLLWHYVFNTYNFLTVTCATQHLVLYESQDYNYIDISCCLPFCQVGLLPLLTKVYLDSLADFSREVFCLKFFNLSVKHFSIPALGWEMCFLWFSSRYMRFSDRFWYSSTSSSKNYDFFFSIEIMTCTS